MLQLTSAGAGASLGLIVRYTDGDREFAYDKSAMGSLEVALIEAPQRG